MERSQKIISFHVTLSVVSFLFFCLFVSAIFFFPLLAINLKSMYFVALCVTLMVILQGLARE